MSTEEEMTKTTFRMPKILLKEVKHYAVENETTDTQVFTDAVRAYMKSRQRKSEK